MSADEAMVRPGMISKKGGRCPVSHRASTRKLIETLSEGRLNVVTAKLTVIVSSLPHR